MKLLSKIIPTAITCLVLLVSVGCKPEKSGNGDRLPFFNTAELTPEWIAPESPEYNTIHKIPEFSLVNQEGATITREFFEDKIYVADFFFATCPGICPMLTNNMKKLQEEFEGDHDILLVSHTVMPERDSVPVLKRYAADNGVLGNKWQLLTGDKEVVYNLARKGYYADREFAVTKDTSAFVHTENFVLIDKKGRIRGVYNGTLEMDTRRLIRHIKTLKKEK